ncbi:acyltransferase family protein [Deminuibacter soli]|uniref:Acyltransferase n=1 Tax=Deminuibacter soli TaxID=2291815 RepID=A0A3E1NHY7_9BACT|nr:acyltransferase [Deminuibacter soli]RFM27388.1 acyltransferase [Deminuibacter soli]
MAKISKLHKLDALRGFAALYVIMHHVCQSSTFAYKNFRFHGLRLSSLFGFGQEAVIIFFLLSGFVIEYSFTRSTDKSFADYFAKRFFRIYIPLFIIFLCSYLVKSWEASQLLSADWLTLAGNCLMLQDLPAARAHVLFSPYMDNSPLWSLAYEWWFYMIYYGIYRYVPAAKQFRFVFALVALAVVTYLFYPFFVNRILLYLGIWWCGVELARLYIKGAVSFSKAWHLFVMVAVPGVIIGLYSYWLGYMAGAELSPGRTPLLELRHFSFTALSLAIAIGWHRLKWIGFNRIFGPFTIFSSVSYVLYIAHYFIAVNPVYLQFIGNPLLRSLVALLLLFGFSYIIELQVYPRVRKMLQTGSKRNNTAGLQQSFR